MDKERKKFYSLDEFPGLNKLVDSWYIIREEFDLLKAPLMEINRNGKSHYEVQNEVVKKVLGGASYGWIEGWGQGQEREQEQGNRDWTQFGLVVDDLPVPFAAGAMPKTQNLLRGVRGIHVAALSRMAPHSLLSTHRHPELPERGLLQLHIGISAPESRNYAYFNVAGEFRQHVDGSAFVFDGSHDHFAVNCSDFERVILYVEFYRDIVGG
jgi:aspartyl/asparaginyl beta-hydroxylase (cupin superfamily)